jgi:uncharacterized RmlC-like cupin family protein
VAPTSKKEDDMPRKLSLWGPLAVAIAATALYVGTVRATPAAGFTGTTLAQGRFGEIDVFNHLVTPATALSKRHRNVWLSWQKTKGPSDLYVQANTWQPGGTTGWHTHPGHSLIIVTAGTVTVYDGDDPDCKPAVYSQGMGFVDPGGDHAHIIRNESDAPASTLAVQLIPAGAARRIDLEDPGNCRF